MKQYNGKTLDEIRVGMKIEVIEPENDGYKAGVFTIREVEESEYTGDLFVLLNDYSISGGAEWLDDEATEWRWVEETGNVQPQIVKTLWSLKTNLSYLVTRFILEQLGYASYHVLYDSKKDDETYFNEYDYLTNTSVEGGEFCYTNTKEDLHFDSLESFIEYHKNIGEIKKLEIDLEAAQSQVTEIQTKLNKFKGE